MKYNDLTIEQKQDVLYKLSDDTRFMIAFMNYDNDTQTRFFDNACLCEFLEQTNAFIIHNEYFVENNACKNEMHATILDFVRYLNSMFTDTIFVCTYEFVNDKNNECLAIYSIDDIDK